MNVRDFISSLCRLIFGAPLLMAAVSLPLGCAMETDDSTNPSSHATQGAEAAADGSAPERQTLLDGERARNWGALREARRRGEPL
jgi:hypothetical protein